MKVLITGVAGHLGSAFARWLQERIDCEIWGVDDFSCGYRENVPLGVKLITGDLGASKVPQADYVFHFAAMAAECLSPFVRSYHVHNNLGGWSNLLNQVLDTGCQRLVFTSSMAVYGNGTAPFSEESPCRPHDPYGAGKLFCETDLRIAGEQHGLDWCAIRPHNIYGPGQSLWQKYRNVLGLWMRAALDGQPMLVYGDGQQRRAFSYVDDILPCLWQAAVAPEASRQIINLGGTESTSILAAAEATARITGAKIEHREARHEVKEAWCTVDKSEKLLGFQDTTRLNAGLKKMWAWAQEAWERFPSRRTQTDAFAIELDRGLYSYWASSRP